MPKEYGSVSIPLDVLKQLDERLKGTHMSRAAYIVVVLNNVLSGSLKSPVPLAPAKEAPKKRKLTAKELRENKEFLPNLYRTLDVMVERMPNIFSHEDFEVNDEYNLVHKETGIPIGTLFVDNAWYNTLIGKWKEPYREFYLSHGIDVVALTERRLAANAALEAERKASRGFVPFDEPLIVKEDETDWIEELRNIFDKNRKSD